MIPTIATSVFSLFALSAAAEAHSSRISAPVSGLTRLCDLGERAEAFAVSIEPQSPSHGNSPNASASTEFTTRFQARQHDIVQTARGLRVTEVEDGEPNSGRVASTRWGLPDMSTREFTFLLPYDASLESIRVDILNEVAEPLTVGLMAPVRRGFDGHHKGLWSDPIVALDQAGRDLSVYESQEMYPMEAIDVASVDEDRAVRMVRIVFYPFRWDPVSMQLTKILDLTVRVSWDQREVSEAQIDRELGDPGLPKVFEYDEQLVVLEEFDSTYTFPPRDATFDYLIVSTEEILANASNMASFINMKQSQGFKVATRSIEWISSSFPSASTQLSLRQYLKSVYQDVGLRYLMIISGHGPADVGTPGSMPLGPIPMFLTWPRGGHQLSASPSIDELKEHVRYRVPTDLYYADLSGSDNWDVDGDGFAGERRDDLHRFSSNPKKRFVTDFCQEIGVARIPLQSVSAIDDFLAELITYQTAVLDSNVLSARGRVMLAMAEYSRWGATHVGAEETGNAVIRSIPSVGNFMNLGPLQPWRAYQVGSFDEELVSNTLSSRWQSEDFGLVVWSGHGDWRVSQMVPNPKKSRSWGKSGAANIANNMDTQWVSSVNPTYSRAFVTSDSCQNASPWPHPSSSGGLATELLPNLLANAAVGALLNTGNGIGNAYRTNSIGKKTYGDDIMVSNVSKLCSGWSLSWSLKKTRTRGDYSGKGTNCGLKAQNLMTSNAFGDPASFYVFEE